MPDQKHRDIDIYTYTISAADSTDYPVVHTYGINLEGKIHLIYKLRDYMVWHVASNTVWTGVGQTGTKPAAYMLMEQVKVEGYRAGLKGCIKIDEIEPGSHWRVVRDAFIQKCNELGGKKSK